MRHWHGQDSWHTCSGYLPEQIEVDERDEDRYLVCVDEITIVHPLN